MLLDYHRLGQCGLLPRVICSAEIVFIPVGLVCEETDRHPGGRSPRRFSIIAKPPVKSGKSLLKSAFSPPLDVQKTRLINNNLIKYFCGILLIYALAVSVRLGAQGPQNVVLVVNQDSPESMEIANHYIGLRDIPSRNVVYLQNIYESKKSKGEHSISAKYRETILSPLLAKIEKRNLGSQIDTIAFSSGFPTRIACSNEQKKYLGSTSKKYDKHFHAPTVSLTSCSYFGESLFDKQSYLFDQDANWYSTNSVDDSISFSSSKFWGKNGIAADQELGRRYYLSSILGIVREGGSTVKQVKQQLTRSAQADGTRPKGIFYFANNSDPRSRTRAAQFPVAKKALESLGYQVQIGSGKMPKSKTILGATLGSAKHDWPTSKSNFVPGAICDNFTSYGAWWEKNQTHLTHFLNNGAGMSTGTVYEPYTIPYKIPTAFTHVHYARGLTAGESIYRTVKNPFQLLVVGDPLCRPFADLPKFSITGLKHRGVVEADLEIKGVPANSESTAQIEYFSLFLDELYQTRVEPNQPVKIALSDIGPGFHELRMVAVDDSPQAVNSTQVIDFFVWPEDRKADLRLELEKDTITAKESLNVSCRFAKGQRVDLRQNGRVIASFKSANQPITIKASKLGKGVSEIYATTTEAGQAISGVPKKVTVR